MISTLPAWAIFEGDPGDEFTAWHGAVCARQGCGVPRWAHIANQLGLRHSLRYWETCDDFLEPAPPPQLLAAPVTPDGPTRWTHGAPVASPMVALALIAATGLLVRTVA